MAKKDSTMSETISTTTEELDIIPIECIEEAELRIRSEIRKTPLTAFTGAGCTNNIHLKLECLQRCGSYKFRGAYNAFMKSISEAPSSVKVCSASSGNFGIALAEIANVAGVPCKIYVPESGSDLKVLMMQESGAEVVRIPAADWFSMCHTNRNQDGELFIRPGGSVDVISGAATIALEILEDLPNVASVIVPWGSGGVLSGIASALRHLKPDVKVYAAEREHGNPLSISLKAGKPSKVPDPQPCFVDGMSGRAVVPGMWNLARNLVTDSIVVSLEEVCESIRQLLSYNKVLAEGAGAVTLAAALQERDDPLPEPIVCVITGGNIDNHRILNILEHKIPK